MLRGTNSYNQRICWIQPSRFLHFMLFQFFPKPSASPSIFGHQPTLLLPCIHSTKKTLELNKNDKNVNLELLFVNIKCFTVCTGNNMTVQYIDWIWNLQRRKCNLIIEKWSNLSKRMHNVMHSFLETEKRNDPSDQPATTTFSKSKVHTPIQLVIVGNQEIPEILFVRVSSWFFSPKGPKMAQSLVQYFKFSEKSKCGVFSNFFVGFFFSNFFSSFSNIQKKKDSQNPVFLHELFDFN